MWSGLVTGFFLTSLPLLIGLQYTLSVSNQVILLPHPSPAPDVSDSDPDVFKT